MEQEKKEWYIGLQIGEDDSQITVYEKETQEAVTADTLVPTGTKVWEVFTDTDADPLPAKAFLESCLGMIPQQDRSSVYIMVTVPKLEAPLDERIPSLLEEFGLERKQIMMQDYASSFYYYVINQKKELWMGDVALIRYRDDRMYGEVLHFDRTKKPAAAMVEEAASAAVDDSVRIDRGGEDWDRERDRLLFEMLKKVFERRNVTTSYLLGDYFDRSWAQRSFQYLCYHRHAFQGKNLYTKGACYALLERCGIREKKDILFIGTDLVKMDLGMNLRIRGKESYYPMITAGTNWYEAHHVCELIPDEDKTIHLLTRTMEGSEEIHHLLRLTDFPKRPNRTVRIRLTVYFVSASHCVAEAEDMGFGEMYKSTGKKWKRDIWLS